MKQVVQTGLVFDDLAQCSAKALILSVPGLTCSLSLPGITIRKRRKIRLALRICMVAHDHRNFARQLSGAVAATNGQPGFGEDFVKRIGKLSSGENRSREGEASVP